MILSATKTDIQLNSTISNFYQSQRVKRDQVELNMAHPAVFTDKPLLDAIVMIKVSE
jgi:hypothetical protein